MSQHLPDEKELLDRVLSAGITVPRDLWNFCSGRIEEDAGSVITICGQCLSNEGFMPVLDAQKTVLCVRDMEYVCRLLTADSPDESLFAQYSEYLPVHTAIRDLCSHKLGNEINSMNMVIGASIDPLNLAPVHAEAVRKILSHAEAIRAFMDNLAGVLARFDPGMSQGRDIYRSLYDSSAEGFVRLTLDGEILECNKAFLDIFGYTKEEIISAHHEKLCPNFWPEMPDSVASDDSRWKGNYQEMIQDCARKDGRIITVSVKTWRILDTQGRPVGMWSMVGDISSMRKDQRAVLREVWAAHAIVDKISDGVTLSDQDGRFEVFNAKMKELTGYTIDEANKSGDFSRLLYPDDADRARALQGVGDARTGPGASETETVIRVKDGSSKTVLVKTALIKHRQKDMFLSVWRDITAMRRAETALRRQEDFTRRLILGSSAATFVIDRDHKVLFWNAACEALTGIDGGEVIGTGNHWKGFYAYQRHCLADYVLDGNYAGIPGTYAQSGPSVFFTAGRHAEDWIVTRDGKERYLMFDAVPVRDDDGNVVAVIETVYDDTQCKLMERERALLNVELVKSNEKLKELTLKDAHTGLYNFRYLEGAIEAEFDRAKRQGQPLSVMMMDIDYFKSINDVYGHQFGDYILKLVSIRLRRAVRRYDTVIRYGGEEFLMICPGSDRANTSRLAGRIISEFAEKSMGNDEYQVRLKTSIGIASYPEDSAIRGMSLVELADRILGKVKETGGNRAFTSKDAFSDHEKLFFDTNDVKSIKNKIERLNKRVNHIVIEELFAFARNSGVRDMYSCAQLEDESDFAAKIARDLQMPPYAVETLSQAAMIHDLGKMGIGWDILAKEGPLSESEWILMKQHPQISADILYSIPSLRPLIPAVLNHHERWDGSGYPNGLKGPEIPQEAAILGVVDTYSALVADRPYRKAFPPPDAVAMIKEGSGKLFSPAVVESFVKVIGI